jgi:hypothetical protein
MAIMRKAVWTAAAGLMLTLAFTLSSELSRWFSSHISLPLSSLLARAASVVPFPVGEILLLAGAPMIALWILWSVIRWKAPRGAAFALSLVFLLYAVLWVPQCHVPAMAAESSNAERLTQLSQTLAHQAESLRETAMAEAESGQKVLSEARDAVASLNLSGQPLAAPKFARYPEILRALEIAGVYAPWTGEAIVSPDEPAFTLPFLAAHELAHASGFAREDEANYVAYRACMTGSARFRYAATIYAFRYAMDALKGMDPSAWSEIRSGLSDGVRDDFWRIDDTGDAATGFSAFTDRAAEVFLQLSGQPSGLSSYGGMVSFLLNDVSLVDDSQALQRQDAVQHVD